MTTFELPAAPASLTGPVKAWSESMILPSYMPADGDRNPLFLDFRVYQGSSGRVYPLPFIDRISTQRELREWKAFHIENDFVRVMILPEIGGRIHVAFDKTNGYDLIYRQNVIKPALVGLAGPWISGGIEFNWPQHHRPATFMPVDVHIQEHPDGARTLWCSDHDPMTRMKGMHGICLYPSRSYIEIRVRLFNRTPMRQTFLWWANAGVHANEHYQSFFPPDVKYIADHARRAVNSYPLATAPYYGVDYPARAQFGVPADQQPVQFQPTDQYPANDLSRYANIPVPTSYMALGSKGDFLGGYDHARQAGVIHVANHHIAPGKKQWTWGNHDFGYAWDRNLTDNDGPYVELMAGVHTDNQPDFSYLEAWETKSFSQFWYPFARIGVPQKANVDAAVSLQVKGQSAQVGVAVTGVFPNAVVSLDWNGLAIAQWNVDLAPATPMLERVTLPDHNMEDGLTLRVKNSSGRQFIAYTISETEDPAAETKAIAAKEPPVPRKIVSKEELYLAGLHLAQYRHPTRNPEDYWLEALKRDPTDVRCHMEMARRQLERGEFADAEEHLQRAVQQLTQFNPNPADGEPFYLLGLCLRYMGRDEEAYDAFYKATWNYAWRSAALLAIAEMDVKAGRWEEAPQRLYEALRLNADNSNARNLAVAVFRHFGRGPQAAALLAETYALDPLDAWARQLAGEPIPGGNQARLDIAFDYMRAGLYQSAIEVLTAADVFATDGSVPMIHYVLAHAYRSSGDETSAQEAQREARGDSADRCFPYRLEEMLALESAVTSDPTDGRAFYLLGNCLYGRQRREQAMDCWEIATRLDPTLSTAWRNFGFGVFTLRQDGPVARAAYDHALAANPTDARVFFERDQLWKRLGVPASERLKEFSQCPELVKSRDDLSLELASLWNAMEEPERAAGIFESRHFQPWEGGEGLVLSEYTHTMLKLGRRALHAGDSGRAGSFFDQALHPPQTLGEARHLLSPAAEVHYWLGEAAASSGNVDAAIKHWQRAVTEAGNPKEPSDQTLYSAMALSRLGERRTSRSLLRHLWFFGRRIAREVKQPDYFATSVPSLSPFPDDPAKRNRILGFYLQTQARLGLGQIKLAKGLLAKLLAIEPNHGGAAELARQFGL